MERMLINVQAIVQDVAAIRRNKLVYTLLTVFILFTLLIKLCPVITLWDKALIIFIQECTKNIPIWIAELPDCKLYTLMIILPLLLGSFYFFYKKMYKNILFLCSIPLVTFLFNCIIKPLIQRARPPYELQFEIHPESFSYVSSHTLVTTCLWGIVIYFLNKYCTNRILRNLGILFSIIWILFVGISRIWLGVHYPTDVIGAYLLSSII